MPSLGRVWPGFSEWNLLSYGLCLGHLGVLILKSGLYSENVGYTDTGEVCLNYMFFKMWEWGCQDPLVHACIGFG